MWRQGPCFNPRALVHGDLRSYFSSVPAFIPPSEPVESDTPPAGKGWLHDVKFDGYRLQLHKVGDHSLVYSKNGKPFAERKPEPPGFDSITGIFRN